MHATKLPMAGGGPRGSTRWSPAGWKSEKTLTSLGGRRKLKPILLLNRGTKDGLKATEGQRGEQIHREHKGTTTATCAEAAHLTRKHNSSTCQILPEARQESAPPATRIPGIHERSNGVKSRPWMGTRPGWWDVCPSRCAGSAPAREPVRGALELRAPMLDGLDLMLENGVRCGPPIRRSVSRVAEHAVGCRVSACRDRN